MMESMVVAFLDVTCCYDSSLFNRCGALVLLHIYYCIDCLSSQGRFDVDSRAFKVFTGQANSVNLKCQNQTKYELLDSITAMCRPENVPVICPSSS